MNLLTDLYFPDSPLLEVKGRGKKNKNVLLTVRGPFGFYGKKNKNGRTYQESLWNKVLSNPDIQQKFKDRAVLGEADHPKTLHPSLSRVSHVVTDLRLDRNTNQLVGEADILDTPNGRIINTLFRSGVKVGISSRGAGGLTHVNGEDVVDEDDYKFGGFDFVVEPSNSNAYPQPVREKIEEEVSSILIESIDEISKDEDYYKTLIEKISPEGSLKLENIEGEVVVIHKGEKIEKVSEAKEKTVQDTNQSGISDTTPDIQELEDLRKNNIFLKDQLMKLREAYGSLREKNKILEAERKTWEESSSIENSEKYQKQIEGLESNLIESSTEKKSLLEELSIVREEFQDQNKELLELREKLENVKSLPEFVETQKTLKKAQAMLLESRAHNKSLEGYVSKAKKEKKKVIEENRSLKEQKGRLEEDRIKVYIELVASENSLVLEEFCNHLPKSPKKEDIDRVAGMLVKSRSYQNSGGDLPDFINPKKNIIIEKIEYPRDDKNEEDGGDTVNRVSSMMKNI